MYRNTPKSVLAIKKLSRGSRQVYSTNRWGLVGEAAAFLDPFYSPGSDFIAIGNMMVGKLIGKLGSRGRTKFGVGIDPNISLAAFRAVLVALNRLLA